MIDVFCSYAHEDEAKLDLLKVHLSVLRRSGLIRLWYDRDIGAGQELDVEVQRHLEQADLILLLVSPSFLASNYCYDREGQRALERHHDGSARVLPIILEFCDWLHTPFAKLRATPLDGTPISDFQNLHKAYFQITSDIRAAAESLEKDIEANAGVVVCDSTLAESTRGDAADSARRLSIVISSVTQRLDDGRLVPANLNHVTGQLAITVRVNPGPEPVAAVSVSINAGPDVVTQTQTVTPDSHSRDTLQFDITFNFNTMAFSGTTGRAALHNGAATLIATAVARTGASASTSAACQLVNVDGAYLLPILAEERGARVMMISVLPVLYTAGRTIISLSTSNNTRLGGVQLATGAAGGGWLGSYRLPVLTNSIRAEDLVPGSVIGIDNSGASVELPILNKELAASALRAAHAPG